MKWHRNDDWYDEAELVYHGIYGPILNKMVSTKASVLTAVIGSKTNGQCRMNQSCDSKLQRRQQSPWHQSVTLPKWPNPFPLDPFQLQSSASLSALKGRADSYSDHRLSFCHCSIHAIAMLAMPAGFLHYINPHLLLLPVQTDRETDITLMHYICITDVVSTIIDRPEYCIINVMWTT